MNFFNKNLSILNIQKNKYNAQAIDIGLVGYLAKAGFFMFVLFKKWAKAHSN